jgi:hypothetical protein
MNNLLLLLLLLWLLILPSVLDSVKSAGCVALTAAEIDAAAAAAAAALFVVVRSRDSRC